MKRNLILTIIAFGASLALCQGLQAQDAAPAPSTTGTDAGAAHGPGRHGGGADQLARLTAALTLTADQQAKIKPILDTFHTAMQSVRSDTTLAQADKMAKIKEARDTEASQISAILTPDQQAKFTAMQEKMHAGGGRHGGGGGASQVAPSAAPSASP